MSIKKKNLLWQTDFISLFCNPGSSCISFCFLVFQKSSKPKEETRCHPFGCDCGRDLMKSWDYFLTGRISACMHPTGDFFNSPFKGPSSAECAVVPIPQGSCSRCVTNLLEAFSKCTSFCLCFPTPHKVLWIITAPAQPLLLPRITSQSVMWRDLKWLSHLKSRVLLSYSFSFSLWACEWEFEEDRSCAVNYLGQY